MGKARTVACGLCAALAAQLWACSDASGTMMNASVPGGASAVTGAGGAEVSGAMNAPTVDGGAIGAAGTGGAGAGAAGAGASTAGAAGAGTAGVDTAGAGVAGGGGSMDMQVGGGGAALPSGTGNCGLPAQYTRALRVTAEVSWPETVSLEGDTGTLVIWGKTQYTAQPDGSTRMVWRTCGALIPVMTTTPLLEGLKFSIQVPMNAFDSPSMPMSEGSLRDSSDGIVIEPGPIVFGVSLSDPAGAWPAQAERVAADHDGDGKPAVTALPEMGDAYIRLPTNVSQLEFIDEVYVAVRAAFRASRDAADCEGQSVSVEPLVFDYSVIDCHVEGRGRCAPAERRFVAGQSPNFKLGTNGTWSEREIAPDASCSDVREALPAP